MVYIFKYLVRFYKNHMFKKNFKYVAIVISVSLLSYGILGLLIYKESLIKAFIEIRLDLITGLLIILFSFFIKFIRWRFILSYLGFKLKFTDDIAIWFSSFALTATPGKVGESVRSYILFEKYKISKSKTVSALIYERITDLFSVLLILLFNITLIFNSSFFYFKRNFIVFIFCLVSILFILKYLSKKFLKKNKIYNFGNTKISRIKETIKSLNSLRLLICSTLLGTLAWLLECFSFWLILNGMNIPNINLGKAAIAHLGAGIIGIVSMMPGGLGTTEISSISILNSYGVELSLATISSILIRLMTLWFATFLGIVCFIYTTRSKFLYQND